MTYIEWFENHAKKHKAIIDRLIDKSDEEIITYFRWENISRSDVDFCLLFPQGKKCHDMENLNCYLCACPNFRFNDNALKRKSYCAIDSKDGKQFVYEEIIHQDCSGCLVPHKEAYIRKHFDRDWKKIMQLCQV